MDNKESIVQAASDLILEKGDGLHTITVREICKKAGVGLGLVNYYFGNKDELISLCVERMIHKIVDKFEEIRERTEGMSAREKLCFLGNMTFDFLFDNYAVSKISILTDMRSPEKGDNTHRTYSAYLPLVAACRPDWDESRIKRATYCLITAMQQAFLRHEIIFLTQGVNLKNKSERRSYHGLILNDILGEEE